MTGRPEIPAETKREILFECRHRCAVCCYPITLEMAHVVPWSETKDHSAANLIALCPNCHSAADKHKWGAAYLSRYKERPCAIASNSLPPLTPSQKALVDMIVAADPADLSQKERMRILSMVAAYVDISLSAVEIVDVAQINSSRITLSLPRESAVLLFTGFRDRDRELFEMFEGVDLMSIGLPRAEGSRIQGSVPGQREVVISIKDLADEYVGTAHGTIRLSEAHVDIDIAWETSEPWQSGFVTFYLTYRDQWWAQIGHRKTESIEFHNGKARLVKRYKLETDDNREVSEVQLRAVYMPLQMR